MTAAILGASAIVAAAIFALLGSMASGRGPAHTADVVGLANLVDQLQEERDYWRDRADRAERARNGRDRPAGRDPG